MISYPALLDRTSGTITIQKGLVIFSSDDGKISNLTLTISRIKVTIGGQNSIHYYLEDAFLQNTVICIQSSEVIDLIAKQGCSSARESLKKTKDRHFWQTLKISSPVILIFFFLLLIPIFFSLIPISWLNNTLSFDQEKRIGNLLLPAIKKDLQIIDKHPAQKKIEDLKNILQQSTPELIPLKIDLFISSSLEANAFALPGGIIVVNQGLISTTKDTAEIIGIIAHELAHIERRHLLKSMAGRIGNLAGIMMLTFFVGSDAIGVVSNINNLISLKYSREDETEADSRGFDFLINAKLSADGMINFFTRLAEKESSLNQALSTLSTHPISKDRVELLMKLKNKNPIANPRQLPWSIKDIQQAQ